MGPIVRAADFIPQIRQDTVITKQDIGKGLYLIIGGLFKKVIISDYINVNFVQYIFDDPFRHSGIECLFGVYGYALVIYCDFSGYSDMAIGMARWMGFTININFDAPYKSVNITEFWRRWHISLSTWLKDYLYIPLGGNRKGSLRTYINLFLTMLLGGLWHGASWTFLLWGALHGAALAVHKLWSSLFKSKPSYQARTITNSSHFSWSNLMSGVITFHFICFCWIFFKAPSFSTALVLLKQIGSNFSLTDLLPLFMAYPIVFILLFLGYLLHFMPRLIDLKIETAMISMPFIGKVIILLLFIWLVIQIKQTEQVMPIYLQF